MPERLRGAIPALIGLVLFLVALEVLRVALVGVLVPGLASAQAKPAAQTAEQAITALEHAWLTAFTTSDVAWYEKNMAAGAVFTSEKGELRDKACTIARADFMDLFTLPPVPADSCMFVRGERRRNHDASRAFPAWFSRSLPGRRREPRDRPSYSASSRAQHVMRLTLSDKAGRI